MKQSQDILIYWPLFLAILPIILAAVVLVFAPFVTVRGLKLSKKRTLKFATTCLLTSVAYLMLCTTINTFMVFQESARLSKGKELIKYDVYTTNSQPKNSILQQRLVSTLRKTSNPASMSKDASSPYIVERYGSEPSSIGNMYRSWQFDSRKYNLKDSDCGPVDPEFSDKKEVGECRLVGQNPQGGNIYILFKKQKQWSKTYTGPDIYHDRDAFTTYGNTRITLDDSFGAFTYEEKINYMKSFKKADINDLKFLNNNSGTPVYFRLPSLI